MTENQVLEALQNHIDIEQALYQGDDTVWLYHFADMRDNLLEWYPFQEGESVLQLGCGYGAMTPLFLKKGLNPIVNITSDTVLMEINKIRFAHRDQVKIRNCSLQELPVDETYDYVYLELNEVCALRMIDDPQTIELLVQCACKVLKPTGHIIIACDNVLAKNILLEEDKQVLSTDMSISRYSKKSLCDILTDNDLSKIQYYYPMPGYLAVDTIYSDEFAGGVEQSFGYAYAKGALYTNDFYEQDMEVENAKTQTQHANSFLIIASVEG